MVRGFAQGLNVDDRPGRVYYIVIGANTGSYNGQPRGEGETGEAFAPNGPGWW